jgi:hypothetical protein
MVSGDRFAVRIAILVIALQMERYAIRIFRFGLIRSECQRVNSDWKAKMNTVLNPLYPTNRI